MSRYSCPNCIHEKVCALWEIQNGLSDTECKYYKPAINQSSESLSVDKKRVIAESCLHYKKSGRCALNGYAPLDCSRCKEWQNNEQSR